MDPFLWVKATVDANTGGVTAVLNMYRCYLCRSSLDKAATLSTQCLHHIRDCKSPRDGLKDTAGSIEVLCRHYAIEHRELSDRGCTYPCVPEPVPCTPDKGSQVRAVLLSTLISAEFLAWLTGL